MKRAILPPTRGWYAPLDFLPAYARVRRRPSFSRRQPAQVCFPVARQDTLCPGRQSSETRNALKHNASPHFFHGKTLFFPQKDFAFYAVLRTPFPRFALTGSPWGILPFILRRAEKKIPAACECNGDHSLDRLQGPNRTERIKEMLKNTPASSAGENPQPRIEGGKSPNYQDTAGGGLEITRPGGRV